MGLSHKRQWKIIASKRLTSWLPSALFETFQSRIAGVFYNSFQGLGEDSLLCQQQAPLSFLKSVTTCELLAFLQDHRHRHRVIGGLSLHAWLKREIGKSV